MSQEDVEIVRSIYEAFNRGDVASARDMLHPDAEMHQPPEVPDAESYYGRDELVRGVELVAAEFDEFRLEPQEIAAAGDGVIVRVHVSGTGKASGIATEIEFFHAWTVRDGMPHRCAVRTTRADALEAVGLAE
jgi:uncharacterized protein